MTLDLGLILGIESEIIEPNRRLMLVTQYNDQVIAFTIDAAERIHRVSWKNFEPTTNALSHENPYINGIIRLEDHLVLVLDLEYILTTVNPNLGIRLDAEKIKHIESHGNPRDHVRILFVEDSPMIRKMVETQLRGVGFSNIELATNGQEGLDKINEYIKRSGESGQPLSDLVNIVLTDIEIPVMDGLTLCRTIKKDLKLDLPVIVFSSLINDQMILKCKSVGADDWGSKPKIELVMDLIDRFVGDKDEVAN